MVFSFPSVLLSYTPEVTVAAGPSGRFLQVQEHDDQCAVRHLWGINFLSVAPGHL